MTAIRDMALDWLPPALTRWIRKLRGTGIRFDGHFATWEEARALCSGYESQEILAKVLAATLKVKRGDAVYERDSVLFDRIEYSWPVLAALMWSAARHAGRLRVMDFGGALGSSYFQNRKFLRVLPELVWNVVEQPHYVAAGRAHIQDQHLQFHETIESCSSERRPNVILLSSVLPYVPRPYELLGSLTDIGADTLILDRTSYSKDKSDDFTRVQEVQTSIYQASYPCHFFNEERLCRFLSARGYGLIETFQSPIDLDPGAYWSGHIFALSADDRSSESQPGTGDTTVAEMNRSRG